MKTKTNIILLTLLCICSVFAFTACGTPDTPAVDPGNESKVVSVTISDHNGNAVNSGVLAVDISAGTEKLSVDVEMTSGTAPEVRLASLNEEVATIANDGTVTLKSVGEAVISASAGNKSHRIVLVVSDAAGGRYSLVVEGGEAQIDGGDDWRESAVVTRTALIALRPVVPENKVFVKWIFESEGLPLNPEYLNQNGDNIFEMPAMNVTVKAQFKNAD